MKDTKVTLVESKEELDKFLLENDVLSVQVFVVSGLSQSYLRGGGTIMENHIMWNVWHK